MTPFDAYRLYVAIKLHMTTDEYDFAKYCGKIRSASPAAFERRNDKWSFVKLAKMFPHEDQLILFLACNHLRNSPYIRDLTHMDEYQERYRKHLRTRESLNYVVEQDLRYLLERYPNPMDMLAVRNGERPLLVDHLQQNKVQIETVCVLGTLLGFFPMWKSKVTDTILWPPIYRGIVKFCTFVPFDRMEMINHIRHLVQREKTLTSVV